MCKVMHTLFGETAIQLKNGILERLVLAMASVERLVTILYLENVSNPIAPI